MAFFLPDNLIVYQIIFFLISCREDVTIVLFFLFLAASAERPPSAASIRGGTRQRLQHPSTRRVYAVDNTHDIPSATLEKSHSIVSAVPSIEAQPIGDDNKNKSGIQQDIPSITPLTHLIFKKIQSAPIEVRISLSKYSLHRFFHSGSYSLYISTHW